MFHAGFLAKHAHDSVTDMTKLQLRIPGPDKNNIITQPYIRIRSFKGMFTVEDLLSISPSESDYKRELQQMAFTKEHELDSIRMLLWAIIMTVYGYDRFVVCTSGKDKSEMTHHISCVLYNRKVLNGSNGKDRDFSCEDASDLAATPRLCQVCIPILTLEVMLVFATNFSPGYNAMWETMMSCEDMKFLKEERIKRHIALFSTKFYEEWMTRISPRVFQTIMSVQHQHLTEYFSELEKKINNLTYFDATEVEAMISELRNSFSKQTKIKNDFDWIQTFLLEAGILCLCNQGFFNNFGFCCYCKTPVATTSRSEKRRMLIKARADRKNKYSGRKIIKVHTLFVFLSLFIFFSCSLKSVFCRRLRKPKMTTPLSPP